LRQMIEPVKKRLGKTNRSRDRSVFEFIFDFKHEHAPRISLHAFIICQTWKRFYNPKELYF